MIIIIYFLFGVVSVLIILEFTTEGISPYRDWLKEELERNPDYINWLKDANDGRDYKRGLKILKRIEKREKSSYNRWLKRMRRIGKY